MALTPHVRPRLGFDLDIGGNQTDNFLRHTVPANNQRPLSVKSALAGTKGRLFQSRCLNIESFPTVYNTRRKFRKTYITVYSIKSSFFFLT